jgi:hypothetical protein
MLCPKKRKTGCSGNRLQDTAREVGKRDFTESKEVANKMKTYRQPTLVRLLNQSCTQNLRFFLFESVSKARRNNSLVNKIIFCTNYSRLFTEQQMATPWILNSQLEFDHMFISGEYKHRTEFQPSQITASNANSNQSNASSNSCKSA